MKLKQLSKDLKTKEPINKVTNAIQWFTPKKKKQWYQSYAATNNPDERLLKNFRGKGY